MKECCREDAVSGSTDANAVRGILSDGLGAEPASSAPEPSLASTDFNTARGVAPAPASTIIFVSFITAVSPPCPVSPSATIGVR